MKNPNKIKCNNIEYRKGYIEVIPDIHENHINLETWEVHPDIDISELDLTDDAFPDDGVTGNTEIELNLKEAEELVTLLQSSIEKIKNKNQGA
jgi:hypothetical protein